MTDESRRKLNVFTFVVGAALTILAIYDLSIGERAASVWIAIVCWPIVAATSAHQLWGPAARRT
ncbi:hypothetical protein HQ604_18510 [Rhodococcus corynebacterioides]|uniref:Uncharacterized protein n=2 Tax=Rhodococcoides corynebacterioides TaxID=53972 RepID=A0ABS7P843_9NOCA|nr:hypothetical protein [Rhodococcus corynebacterioides]MBY6409895.1 hypothetical protein [Rhodococcus corynebacterioides]